jgi:hypothetical protein
MLLPDRIQLLHHQNKNSILRRHDGSTITLFTIDNKEITVETGDYVGLNCHVTLEWMVNNPDSWLPLDK